MEDKHLNRQQPIEPTSATDQERALDETVSLNPDSSIADKAKDDFSTLPVEQDALPTGQPMLQGEFGDYELLEEIARGGMGVVYRARQKKANRIVALKMILSGSFAGQEEIDRFYAEAEAAANLDHPNIVPVYDVGQFDGRHYFSMGFVDGKSLSEIVREQPLEPIRAASLMKDVSSAVAYAHDRKIIHRDLKPQNILVDQDGKSRVTDFGLAKRIEGDSDLTESGQVMGTPSFMPPEQALGDIENVGPLSDVYSLGAVLYHLVTGRPPFRAASVVDTLRQVVEQEPVSPRQLNPVIDRDLETICLKALDKTPARRYESAEALADDLERYLERRPISARRISTSERTFRWARRNKIIATLLSITVLLLIATTIVSTIVAIQFRDEERRQRENASTQSRLRKAAEQAQKETRQNLYDAEMANSGVAFRSYSGIGQVRVLVEHWSPQLHEELLGWEWYFLNAVSHRENRVLEGGQYPWDAKWHPDGKTIALGGSLNLNGGLYLGKVDAKNVSTGFLSSGVPCSFRSLCWSPDGDWIAGTGKNIVSVWEYPSRDKRWQKEFDGEDFCAIGCSPTQDVLAVRSMKGTVYILDVENGEVIKTLPDVDAVEPNTIGFSYDGKWLATAINYRGEKNMIKIWNTSNWTPEVGFPIPDPAIFGFEWSPTSNLLAAGGDEAKVYIYDIDKQSRIDALKAHDRRITDVAWSPDGRRLASCSEDFTIVIFDVLEDQLFERLRGHTDRVRFVDWSKTGNRLLSVGHDYRFRVWNLDDPSPNERINLEHHEKVYASNAPLQWHPKRDLVAISLDSGPKDGNVVLWDIDRRVCEVPQPGLDPNWSYDGKYLAAVVENSIAIYGENGASVFKNFEFPTKRKFFLDWHPREPILALVDQNSISLWHVEQDDQPKPIRQDGDRLRAVAWNPAGSELAVGAKGTIIEICDAKTGRVLRISDRVTDMYTKDIEWSPDGNQVANTAVDRTDVMIWDSKSMSLVAALKGHTYGTRHVAWSPDGSRIAASGADESVNIWSTKSHKLLLSLWHHTVDGIDWSPDGRRLAGIGKHGRLIIWDSSSGHTQSSPK